MEVKSVIVCLCVCVCFTGVLGQVGSLCRPNERLLPCGCPKTCRAPAPDCAGVCKFGCFCEDGEVRNDEGVCVKLADCPPIASRLKLETTEPRTIQCSKDEEYRFCEPCNRTCDNPNPVCPAQCSAGCFCKGDLLRDKDGRCVKYEKCSNYLKNIEDREKNFVEPIPYRFSCGRNQVYRECQNCTRTCSDPEPVCGTCKTGCVCKDGYVKAPDGKCVKVEDCPQAQISFGEAHITFSETHVTFDEAQGSSIEDCASGEEYLSCGWCEPTCREPEPSCPAGCTRGCLCRPPLLRHASGHCVSREQCTPQNCTDSSEEYKCLYGCEPRCSKTLCSFRQRRCVLGCHCKRGFLRDVNGRCVTENLCAYIFRTQVQKV